MALRGYSGQAVTGTWSPFGLAEIDIVDGRVDGPFIQITRNAARWTLEGDGQANETRVKGGRRSRAIAVTLSASSPTNAALSAAFLADEELENVVGALLIKDLSGNTIIEADGCFLEDINDLQFAMTRGERTWVFLCANVRMFVGGHDVE